MRAWRRALGALAAFMLLGAAPRGAPVELTLTPELGAPGLAAIDFALTFNGAPDGETILRLPDTWGGHRQLYKAVRDLSADGATIAPGRSPSERRLLHAPGARITLRYRIVDDKDGPPRADADGNDYRPIVKPAFFHLLGNAVVVQPDNVDGRHPATFRLGAMPPGMSFASDLEHGAMGRPLTMDALLESVIVGGDFRLLDAGGGARVAIRGAWMRADRRWSDVVGALAAAERAYWGDRGEPYLVTVLPITDLGPSRVSVGGTGRNDAFAFFATPNAPPELIDRVLAHEMAHTWIPGRIGGNPWRGETADYWLSEGFTDFVAWRAMVRAGLMPPEQFAAVFNDKLSAYDRSSVRTVPNARVAAGFWTSRPAQELPYQRGMLLATLWDARARAATNGRVDLDDVLKAMHVRALSGARLTAATAFPLAMRKLTGVDVGPDIARFVNRGEAIELPPDLFAPCGRIEDTKFGRAFVLAKDMDAAALEACRRRLAGV